jgi:D-sedoheptulose 7-phosphate isomerase
MAAENAGQTPSALSKPVSLEQGIVLSFPVQDSSPSTLHLQTALNVALHQAVAVQQLLLKEENQAFILDFSQMMIQVSLAGGKFLIAGNGGSMADAMHFAEELTGQFRRKRRAIPAIALSDPTHMSCVSNDFGFQHIFSRGIEAFGNRDDLFIGLTTSGNSKNIELAVEEARRKGMKVVLLLGKDGGTLLGKGDLEVLIPGFGSSDRIQEAHMTILHLVIELFERQIFPQNYASEDVAS